MLTIAFDFWQKLLNHHWNRQCHRCRQNTLCNFAKASPTLINLLSLLSQVSVGSSGFSSFTNLGSEKVLFDLMQVIIWRGPKVHTMWCTFIKRRAAVLISSHQLSKVSDFEAISIFSIMVLMSKTGLCQCEVERQAWPLILHFNFSQWQRWRVFFIGHNYYYQRWRGWVSGRSLGFLGALL